MFDFNIFTRMVVKEYNAIGNHPYSLCEVLSIFKYYFDCYQCYTGNEHPHLRPQQIKQIIVDMPECEAFTFEAEDYKALIDGYFLTAFNSDRNINHFFSGQIRAMRGFENGFL